MCVMALHPTTIATMDSLDEKLLATGSVTAVRQHNDARWSDSSHATLFDCGGVAVFSFVPESGRPQLSLQLLMPEIDVDAKGEQVYTARRVIETISPRNDKRLAKESAKMLAAATALAERRLAGWKVRSGWAGPWQPNLGLGGFLELCGGFCLVHPAEHRSVSWLYRDNFSVKRLVKALKDVPVAPPALADRERVPVAILAEAAAEAEQRAVVSALIASRPELSGTEVAETAMVLLSARQRQALPV